MAAVKRRDTAPEMAVRSLVRKNGYRFRLHGRRLPGTPDLVFPRLKKVIFVHGCFWHGHKRCLRGRRPASRKAFWNKKLDTNIIRDKRDIMRLKRDDWRVLVIWECELKRMDRLSKRLSTFLAKK